MSFLPLFDGYDESDISDIAHVAGMLRSMLCDVGCGHDI